jgi:ubiquinone/menaquinone biosynthesis C-methylase UbiE
VAPPLARDGYKQAVARHFDGRTDYHRSVIHAQVADRLVRLAAPQPNEWVLDIATGTGFVAIPTGRLVGEKGRVIGVDISTGMLEQATEAVENSDLNNIDLVRADAEELDYPEESFDLVTCCNALPYMTDGRAALRRWYSLLRPAGRLAFNCWAEDSYVTGSLLRIIAAGHGIQIPVAGRETGTPERCREVLLAAGFIRPEVVVEPTASYFSMEQFEMAVDTAVNNPLFGITAKDASRLDDLRDEYMTKARSVATRQAIDTEMGAYFVLAYKQDQVGV